MDFSAEGGVSSEGLEEDLEFEVFIAMLWRMRALVKLGAD